MAKLVITQRPGPFKKTVKVIDPEGKTLDMPVTFKYRTRTELAKFNDAYMDAARERTQKLMDETRAKIDATIEEAKAKAKAEALEAGKDEAEADAAANQAGLDAAMKVKPLSEMTLADAHNFSGAQYVVDVLEAWDQELELNLENAQILCDLYPGAVKALSEVYNQTLKEGRQGN